MGSNNRDATPTTAEHLYQREKLRLLLEAYHRYIDSRSALLAVANRLSRYAGWLGLIPQKRHKPSLNT